MCGDFLNSFYYVRILKGPRNPNIDPTTFGEVEQIRSCVQASEVTNAEVRDSTIVAKLTPPHPH